MTFGMGAALLLYFGWRLSRAIKPREEWETLEEFKERKEREWRRPRDDEQRLSEQDMRRRAQKDSKTLRYASLIMLLGALAYSAACTYVGLSVWELEQNGLRVKGEVIDLDKRSNSDGTTFAPIVRFDTNEGQTITHISLSGSNPPMYQRGDQVEIIYDPANPDLNVMINEGWWNWLLTGILGGFSLIFLLIACSGLMRNTQKL